MALTDTAVRAAKPKEKAYKLHDARGLFLLINKNGSKWWRFRYRYQGREKQLSVGTYPDTSLKLARSKRDDARRLLAAGVDPSETRKAAKTYGTENSFEVVALEWHTKFTPTWTPGHAKTILSRLKRDFSHGWAASR